MLWIIHVNAAKATGDEYPPWLTDFIQSVGFNPGKLDLTAGVLSWAGMITGIHAQIACLEI
jgi:hypothetical protein